MTNPPTSEPEPQWQQPAFGPKPEDEAVQQPAPLQSWPGGIVQRLEPEPPSSAETVIGALAGLVWPVAMIAWIFGGAGFLPMLMVALIGSTVLGALKKNMKQRRVARATNLSQLPPPEQR